MSRSGTTELSTHRLSRRGVLGGLVLIGAGALVACSSGGNATPTASGGGAAAPAASSNVTPTSAAGGAAAPAASSNATAVTMADDNKFNPAAVTIAKGGTITWTNKSATMQHSVTFDPSKAVNKADAQLPEGVQPFDSGLLQPGATYSHTFDTAGTYKYFCIPHESLGMVGTVVVQ
jgi:plastocyanin